MLLEPTRSMPESMKCLVCGVTTQGASALIAHRRGQQIHGIGADVSLPVRVLHDGAHDEPVLDRVENDRVIVERYEFDSLVANSAQRLGGDHRGDVGRGDHAVDLVLLRGQQGVDLLVARFLFHPYRPASAAV